MEWRMFPREWIQNSAEEPKLQTRSDGQNLGDESRGFTAVTYNVLDEGFMQPGTYKHLAKNLWKISDRHPNIMVEIKTMDPDIISLQEVHRDYYYRLLHPAMVALGYEGTVLVDEEVGTLVGQATFWRKDRFNFLHKEGHYFHDLAKDDIERAVRLNKINSTDVEAFSDWLRARNLILIAHLQEVTSGFKVIIGAPHLIWEGFQLPALKVLQAALGLRAMGELSRSTGTEALVMMGDFNAQPAHPTYRFLEEGRVTRVMGETITTMTNQSSSLSKESSVFGATVLNILPDVFQHDFNLSSAYKAILGHEPEITDTDVDIKTTQSEIDTFTLDYIWYTEKFLYAGGVLGTPPKSAILKHTGLPSVLFPSDHLPLMAKLYFKQPL